MANTSLNTNTNPSSMDSQFKVRLIDSNNPTDVVIFDVSPEITESLHVDLKSMSPVHMPGQIFVYGSTGSRTFSLSAKLISRNIKESTANIKKLWLLRSWAFNYFGKSDSVSETQSENRMKHKNGVAGYSSRDINNLSAESRKNKYGQNMLGAPPDVLRFYAYSHSSRPYRGYTPTNIHNVPVVLSTLSVPYTSEVDYIPTDMGVPFPVSMTVEISLQESHAPDDYSEFNLYAFKQGILDGF